MNRWIRRNYKAFWAIVIALLLTLSTVGFPVYAYASEPEDNSQVETVIDDGVKLNGGEEDEVEVIDKSGVLPGGAPYDVVDGVLTIHEGTINNTSTDKNNRFGWVIGNDYTTYYVKKVVFDGNVTAIGSLNNFFKYFSKCKEFEGLDKLNTTQVTDMSYMFGECRKLEELDLSSFDTSNVTDMSAMFIQCRSLKRIDLSNFDTSKVENMHSLFSQCYSLESINFNGIDTSNVSDMSYMFWRCKSLNSLDLSAFNTSNVNNMEYMFAECISLSKLDLSSFITPELLKTSAMFRQCSSLEELDISNLDKSNVQSYGNDFSGCDVLSRVKIGENFSFNESCLPVSPTCSGRWMLEDGDIEYDNVDIQDNYPSGEEGLIPGTYVWADDNIDEAECLITYSANAGIGNERVQHIRKGVNSRVLSNWFTMPGYEFVCWNTSADGTGVSYDESESIVLNNNIILYPQWNLIIDDAKISDATLLTSLGGEMAPGNYYLDSDIQLDSDIIINGDATIWLNGHVLRGSGSKRVLTVNGGTLIIRDGNEESVHYYKVEDGLYEIISEEEWSSLDDSVEKGIINGGVITGGRSILGGGICVEDGTLHIIGGTICGNTALKYGHTGGAVYVKGAMDMQGGNICGNRGCLQIDERSSRLPSVVQVEGSFVFSGGSISYNSVCLSAVAVNCLSLCGGKIAYNDGDGVQIKWPTGGLTGEFSKVSIMTDGEISHNSGTGVYYIGTHFVMNGGVIDSNNGIKTTFRNAGTMGGGIYGDAFRMNGGVICNNKAGVGGGIITGTTELRGGIIENNSAQYGGGVYSTGNLYLSDTKIINNRASVNGGGVYAFTGNPDKSEGTVLVSGSPVITGNMRISEGDSEGIADNMYLCGSWRIEDDYDLDDPINDYYNSEEFLDEYVTYKAPVVLHVTAPLSNTAVIGVTAEETSKTDSPVVITQDYDKYNPGVHPSTFFVSDNEDYKVLYNDDESEAVLAKTADVTYNAIFKVGNEVVATVPFTKGDKSLTEPKIPDKPNYTGKWDSYNLQEATGDIVIQGIYTPIDSDIISDIGGEASAEYVNGKVKIYLNAASSTEKIRVVSEEAKPIDVVMVLDQSGSMTDKLGENQTKRDALVNCASDFVDQLYNNSLSSGANHRVALVGFAYGSYNRGDYVNTGLLATSNGQIKNYANLTSEDYANALLPINVNGNKNDNVTAGINSIAAEGATSSELGLRMAKDIFAETPVDDNRERIVIFITDGTPTCWGETPSLITKTAAESITVANTIKNAQNAKIYSIGVAENANPDTAFSSSVNGVTTNSRGEFVSYDLNRFLHAVSSNYPNASAISTDKLGDGDKDGGYYMAVNDTSNLGRIFDNILYNTVYEIKTFDKATISYTLSSDFVLTMEQELDIYKNLKNSLGLSSDDIIIVRNDDGTTTLTFKNVPVIHKVVDGIEGYYATVDFEVSPAKETSGNGVSTGISAEVGYDGNNVSNNMDTAVVNIPADRNIIVFKLNGKIYRMVDAAYGEEITVPVSELATWTVPYGTTVTGTYAEFEATDLATYNMHWIVNGRDIVVPYQVGDKIVLPDENVTKRDGFIFLGWNQEIPSAMPPHDVTCTAMYTAHTHQWVEKYKTGTCDIGITKHYVCAGCDETKTEEIAAHEHSFVAVLSENGTNQAMIEKVVCTDCGYSKDQNITYKVQTALSGKTQVLDMSLYKDAEIITLPDHTILMRFYIGDSDKTYRVTRIDADGKRTYYYTQSVDGYLEVELDHFSIYTLGEMEGDNEADPLTYEQCQAMLNGDENMPVSYTITYDGNGSTDGTMANQPATAGVSSPIIKNEYVRSGYTFAGWNTKADGSGESYADQANIVLDGDITLYAQWTVNQSKPSGGGSGGSGGGSGSSGSGGGSGGSGGGSSDIDKPDDSKPDDTKPDDTKPDDNKPQSGNVFAIDESNGTATVKDAIIGGEAVVPIEYTQEGKVYRMYDPMRGEHFYTKNAAEAEHLKSLGWQHESNADFMVVSALDKDATAVYRLYNPNGGGMHFYTENATEAKNLKAVGWNYEGVSHYVYTKDSDKGVSQFRLYNPNSPIGEHNWTTDIGEWQMLVNVGWKDEGVCWKIGA